MANKKRIDAETEFLKRNEGDNRGKSWWTRALQDLNLLFNPYHDWFDYKEVDNKISNFTDSMENQITKEGLTGAEREANAFNAEEAQKSRDFTEYMARNKYSIETASMQDAGVNPAMLYGGGNLVSTASNGAQASSVAPSSSGGILGAIDSIMALVRMPSELKKIQAEINQTNASAARERAEAKYTAQRTETEVFNTKMAQIESQYKDALTQQELDNLKETYKNIAADTDLKISNRDKIDNEAEAQRILNQYIDERQRAEIDQIKSNKEKLDADAAKSRSENIYQVWMNGFVQKNGFLPSSNDILMLGTYIASIFGIKKDDLDNFIHNLLENGDLPNVNPNKKETPNKAWKKELESHGISVNEAGGR